METPQRGTRRKLEGQMIHNILAMPDLKIHWDNNVELYNPEHEKLD